MTGETSNMPDSKGDAMEPRSLSELKKFGEDLGLSGAELIEWIDKQQTLDRDERQRRREEAKEERRLEEAREKREHELEQERLAAEEAEKKRQHDLKLEQEKLAAEEAEKKRQHDLKLEQEKFAAEAEEAERKRQYDWKLEQEKMAHELKMKELESAGTANQAGGGSCVPKAPKLLNFTDGKDSIEEYIIRFERFATENKWPKSGWATNLSALLSGKALGVYSRMSSDDAKDFEKLKKALLARYDLNAEGFRKKMRSVSAEEMESPEQYYDRLCNYMNKWMELSDTKKDYKSLFNLVVMEQFIEMCSLELSTFLKERSCKDYKEVLAASEQYLIAHGKQLKDCQKKKKKEGDETGDEKQAYCVWCHRYGHNVVKCEKKSIEPGIVRCYYCRVVGHNYQLCRKYINDKKKNTLQVGAAVEVAGAGQGFNPYPDTRTCFICRQVGHISSTCPERQKPPYTPPQNNHACNYQAIRSDQANRPQTGCVCMEQQVESKQVSDTGAAGFVDTCGCVSDVAIQTACGKKIEFVKCGCDHTVTARKMPVMMGTLNGTSVEVLRDTGCTGVVTKKAFVKKEQYTGQYKVMIRIDNSRVKAPTAKVKVDTPYYSGVVEAVCLDDALYDLVIGNIDGAKDPVMQQEADLGAKPKKPKDKPVGAFEGQDGDVVSNENELTSVQYGALQERGNSEFDLVMLLLLMIQLLVITGQLVIMIGCSIVSFSLLVLVMLLDVVGQVLITKGQVQMSLVSSCVRFRFCDVHVCMPCFKSSKKGEQIKSEWADEQQGKAYNNLKLHHTCICTITHSFCRWTSCMRG